MPRYIIPSQPAAPRSPVRRRGKRVYPSQQFGPQQMLFNAAAEAGTDLYGIASTHLLQSFGAAITAAMGEELRMVQALAYTFQDGLADASKRQQLHDQVGRAARQSTLSSYNYQVASRKKVASYRQGAGRQSGGALRDALASSDIYEATPNGIGFPNVSLLNREASHWARLNFGALPAGRGSRRNFQIYWNDVMVAELGFNAEARPAFGMPPGYWVEGGPGGKRATPGPAAEFHVSNRGLAGLQKSPGSVGYKVRGRQYYGSEPTSLKRPTAGIVQRNFLDAGLAKMAAELPHAYLQFYEELWARAQQNPIMREVVSVRPSDISAYATYTERFTRKPGDVGS